MVQYERFLISMTIHLFSRTIATLLIVSIALPHSALAAQSDVVNAVNQIRLSDPNVPVGTPNPRGLVGNIIDNMNGVSARYSNTTGSNNTVNGAQSLLSSTIGINNTVNGSHALQSNITGSNKTANGVNAKANLNSANTALLSRLDAIEVRLNK